MPVQIIDHVGMHVFARGANILVSRQPVQVRYGLVVRLFVVHLYRRAFVARPHYLDGKIHLRAKYPTLEQADNQGGSRNQTSNHLNLYRATA